MELKAKKDFTDRKTNKEYKKDDKFKVDEETGKRILNSPYDVAEEAKKESLKGVKKELANEDAANIIEKEENQGTK